jgi:hypothetical protein
MSRLERNRRSARRNGIGMLAFGVLILWIAYDAQFQHKVIRTGWGAGWMPPEAGFVVALVLFVFGSVLLVSSFIRHRSDSQ